MCRSTHGAISTLVALRSDCSRRGKLAPSLGAIMASSSFIAIVVACGCILSGSALSLTKEAKGGKCFYDLAGKSDAELCSSLNRTLMAVEFTPESIDKDCKEPKNPEKDVEGLGLTRVYCCETAKKKVAEPQKSSGQSSANRWAAKLRCLRKRSRRLAYLSRRGRTTLLLRYKGFRRLPLDAASASLSSEGM